MNSTGLNYISCEVGNPFPQDHTMQFKITVRLEDFHNIEDTELLFRFSTESGYSADTDISDNSVECMYHQLRFSHRVSMGFQFITGYAQFDHNHKITHLCTMSHCDRI